MTEEEKLKKLEEILPNLVQDLNEDDINNYIIATTKDKMVFERRFKLLLDKLFELLQKNETQEENK